MRKVAGHFSTIGKSIISGWVFAGCTLVWAVAAHADISGVVFQDYPASAPNVAGVYGEREAGEPGVAGVTVQAVDENGSSATTSSGTDGTWSLSGLVGAVRVQFLGLPSYLAPSPLGSDSQSRLRFGNEGDSNLDLALHAPSRYSQANPDIAFAMYHNGDASLGGSTAGSGAILTVPYNSSGETAAHSSIVSTGAVGAIYGLAWQKDSQSLFSAAFLKRHTGLLGSLGSVFITDSSGTREYVDLAAAPYSIDFGSINNRGLPSGLGDANHDVDAFQLAHKIGIGDMDISHDGEVLYLVNLFDKKLYQISIANPAKVSLSASDIASYAIPVPTCSNGEWRPFGLGVWRQSVYVGGVCSAENGGSDSDLTAHIYVFDTLSSVFGASPVLSFGLDYPRLKVNDAHSSNCDDGWSPWSDDYSDVVRFADDNEEHCYTQPTLSDIVLDTDDALILGFRDRFTDQFGEGNYAPVTTDTQLMKGQAYGDILRAAKVGNTYQLENGGLAGTKTGCSSNNNDGPGGGEFYCEDNHNSLHPNTSLGALAGLQGSRQVVVSTINPFSAHSNGLDWMSNENGLLEKAHLSVPQESGDFNKAGGMGDIELLSEPAPLQIGNRVWDDLNGNGLQDPGEPGLSGVSITLVCGSASATTTSSASGSWRIDDSDMSGGLIPRNSSCELTVPTSHSGRHLTGLVGDTQLGNDANPLSGKVNLITGNGGQNDHQYDFGYTTIPACALSATAVANACVNGGGDSNPNNDTYTVTLTVGGSAPSSAFDYASSPGTQSANNIAYSASPYVLAPIVIQSEVSPLSFVITDSVDSSCQTTTNSITEPATCSTPGLIDLELKKTVRKAN